VRVVCGRWGLNVGLDVSFDNNYDWKEILAKAEELKSKEAYITNDGGIPPNTQRV
jgi:hypothetical protein